MCYAVNEAFIRLHRSGKIYRKESIVNGSCHLQSAISDIEVDYKMVDGPKLIHVPGCEKPVTFGQIYEFAYKLLNSDEEVVVSTTRPETLLGDTAVAVHPEDSRFAKYIGKYVRHPIRLDAIPVIADCKVDREFGTGSHFQ
jgi:valyl-tRNA synthetase